LRAHTRQAQGARLPSVSRGCFFAPARNGRRCGSANAAAFRPIHIGIEPLRSSSLQEFFHFCEQTKIFGPEASSPSEATRPPTPGRMGCPAGADRIGIGPDLCQDRPVSTFRRMRSGRVGRRECAAARRCKACPISRDAGPVRTPPETSVRSKTAGRGAASGRGRRKRSCASPASAHSTRRV